MTAPRFAAQRELFDAHKVKLWAYENAYTLIFLAFMFFITWGIITVVALCR